MSLIAKPPATLYSCDVLMGGFDIGKPDFILDTFSFKQYLAFEPLKLPGRQAAESLAKVATHDAAVNFHLLERMHAASNPNANFIGVMGGHSIGKTTAAYLDMANLARFLSQQGFIIVTGGVPGMMEAAHSRRHAIAVTSEADSYVAARRSQILS